MEIRSPRSLDYFVLFAPLTPVCQACDIAHPIQSI
jgi:hypothetical protein